MYVSDQKITNVLAIFVLLVGPWLGISRDIWGWMLEVLLLLAVLWVGRKNGFKLAASLMLLGYGVAFVAGGGLASLEIMGFVPWAGLFSVWGMERAWSQKANFFWSLCLAGVLGVLSVIPVIYRGIGTDVVQELIRSMMDQYRQSGMLAALTQQGMSEADIQSYMQQALQYFFLFIPGLAALGAMFEYSTVNYFYMRWFPREGQTQPFFVLWRLPWYAIWGVNLGIASYLIGTQWNAVALRVFGMNLILVYAVVALVLGSSIFLYYLRSPFLSRLMKAILIFTSFFYFQVTIVSLVLLGLLDLVLNFRRLPGDSQ